MSIIPISDSGPMKQEVAKQLAPQMKDSTNLRVTPQSEQTIYNTPYGKDGMKLTPQDDYRAFATILPNAEAEKARQQLKKEGQKKKKKQKEKKKKESFWSWLFSK